MEALERRFGKATTDQYRLHDMVTTDATRNRYTAAGLWDDHTLIDRFRAHVRDRPEAIALVDRAGERRVTNAELASDARRIAAFLADRGVGRGDVISVQLPNSYEFVAIALGVFCVGGVLNPLLPGYRAKELQHVVTHAGTRVIFTPSVYRDFEYRPMIAELESGAPRLDSHVVVGDGRFSDAISFELITAALDPSEEMVDPGQAAEVSELIFTSGTEAQPKGVMHTEQTANFSMRAAWDALGMNSQDVIWMPSPLGHSTGFNYGARYAIYHGAKLVLQDKWNPQEAATLIEQERCTYTLAATTFLQDLVLAGQAGVADLSSMRLFGCGGAPVPPDLVRAAEEIGITVLRLYGSTEALCISWNLPDSSLAQRLETDGRPLGSVEVEARQEEGRRCAQGEPGEAYIRGPNTCVGFFRDEERTRATFDEDGWIKSGDIITVNVDGHVTVVGRKKEIIIRGGVNIAPREIEEFLAEMPQVKSVAVAGLPDERLGEISCAFIVLAAGAKTTLTLEEVVRHLERCGIAKYKFPERLRVVDKLPLTASGKVQKHKLVEAEVAATDISERKSTDERN